MRASFLIDRALRGLSLDFEDALAILRQYDDFTNEQERQRRDVLVAALDNLIDFAILEEYTMVAELPEDTDNEEACEAICEQYNLLYASEENLQVLHAAKIAAWWLTVSDDSIITFMTQGDERVRPWHHSHEGVRYRKSEFPPELIPPIEWGCRCYLISELLNAVSGSVFHFTSNPEVNAIFRESLATGGRIFSDAHPYFRHVPAAYNRIKARIKQRLGYGAENYAG